MTEPLRLAFEVACPVEHAFTVWTTGIGTWWPRDHTVTGRADLAVVLQAGVGGRIYERTPGGTELDWGRVTVWQPPSRLAYRWHLGRDPADATDVDIRFVSRGDTATRVEIEHRGWERLGDAAGTWRDRNALGWQSLRLHFTAASTDTAIATGRLERGRHESGRHERGQHEWGQPMNAGTRQDPWALTTAPGTSTYTTFRDADAKPPALVCQVGSTILKYHLRAVEDLHAWLVQQGNGVPLGAADEKKPVVAGTVEEWGRSPDNPVGGWYGLRSG